MSRLVAFYRGEGSDTEGRTLTEIWGWGDDELEEVHDFIQWLFPLPEPSRFNPDAPLLTPEDIATFQKDNLLRSNLLRSFTRFLGFLGLAVGQDGQVVEGPSFGARSPDVWSFPNYNLLRVSRVLRSLTLLGLGDQARAFYAWLDTAYRNRRFPIGPDTFRYWTKAVRQG